MNKKPAVVISTFMALLMLLSMLYVSAPVVSNDGYSPFNVSAGINRANITLTGNAVTDFSGDLINHNNHTSPWGSTNNLTDLYVAYNETCLFIGLTEIVSGNNLMIFLSNDTNSGYGLYNLSKFSGANGYGGPQGINFTQPVNAVFAVYFSSPGAPDTPVLSKITSTTSQSNTTVTSTSENFSYKINSVYDTTEMAIPLIDLYAAGNYTNLNFSLSAFVVGDGALPSSGNWAWVGMGMPFSQIGQYNAGNTIPMFTINNTFVFQLSNVVSEKVVQHTTANTPINVNIIFNDHQPLYKVVGSNNYILPWTEAHATAEYISQALILHMFPGVNITYELSGSLLYQLVNTSADPMYNNTYIQGAFIPWSEINSTQNQSLYNNLTLDYFSTPGYVFALNEPASNLYSQLHSLWGSGVRLNETQFEDAKVLWFLYDISTSLVEGLFGPSWTNSTIWAMHNMTSFNQADLVKILQYSKWLTGQVIPAFRSDMLGNVSGSNNAELFTSPFYHPLVPLLLTTNISGPQGTIYKSSYFSDLMAQINVSFGQFKSLFGQYPTGLYSPEAAVSYPMIQAVNESGATWFQSSQSALGRSGVSVSAYGDSGANASSMENLYQPYQAVGPNNTTAYMFFRDGYLSDQWGFNYGSEPTWTAVDNFINYLKGVYNTIPVSYHKQTVVTVLLDGENWMFMAPFVNDAIPFLMDLYKALEQNSTYIHTVTPSQYLSYAAQNHISIPKLDNLSTGSWNAGSNTPLPYQNNTYLTQWSGSSIQDFYWQALQNVRSEILAYQNTNGLTQLQNYTAFEQNMTANTKEGNMTRAWNAIYDAEGSDWTFTMAPWTIGGANTLPFDYLFKADLAYALRQLDLPIPVYLTETPATPLSPYKSMNTTVPLQPTLNGYPQYTNSVQGGLAFAVNNESSWDYAAIYNGTTPGSGINNVTLSFSATDMYVQLNVSGNPQSYVSGSNSINLYFSTPNQGYANNMSMDVQSATFQTAPGAIPIGFPALYRIAPAPSTIKNGLGQYNVYVSEGFGSWSYQTQDSLAPLYIGSTIQFLIPFTYLNYVPGNSFELAAFVAEPSTSLYSMVSPIFENIPLSLAQYTPVSSIQNTVPANGPGNYTYPNQPGQIPPGSLDLKWVNVSLNSFDMKWVFTFGQLWNIWSGGFGFSNQIVNIFISDGSNSGTTFLGLGPNANDSMPWQTMLYLSGFATYAMTPSGQQTNGIIVSVNYTAGTVTFVVPTAYIGPDPLSYNYLIVAGSYDGYGTNGWRIVDSVNTTNGGWQGGGGDPPWSSNIYDYIAPATVGQGNLTQQNALQYSPHHIPTLEPITLPRLSNNTTAQKSYFNSTYYNNPTISVYGGTGYVSYISNVSGTDQVYISTSTDFKIWSAPKPVPGTAGATTDQLVTSNGSLYLVTVLNGQVSVFSTLNGDTWSLYYSGQHADAAYGTVSGTSLYLVLSKLNQNSSYSYEIVQVSSGAAVQNHTLQYLGKDPASITSFTGDLAIAYYSGTTNETIYTQVFSASMQSLWSIERGNQSNIDGVVSIGSAGNSGNLFVLYATNSSSQYTIFMSNATAFKDSAFKPTVVMVSATGVNDNPYIYLDNTGGSNYTVLVAWHSTTAFQNMVWAMMSSYSFAQNTGPAKAPSPASSPFNIAIILIIVIAAAAIGAVLVAYTYYIKRKR